MNLIYEKDWISAIIDDVAQKAYDEGHKQGEYVGKVEAIERIKNYLTNMGINVDLGILDRLEL